MNRSGTVIIATSMVMLLLGEVTVNAQAEGRSKRRIQFTDVALLYLHGINWFYTDRHFYVPELLMVSLKPCTWSIGKHMTLSPEISPVGGYARTNEGANIEAGVNLNLSIEREMGKGMFLSFAMGTGPHMIATATLRQVKGYLFSDQWYLRLRGPMSSSTSFHILFGVRHLSNANFDLPNGGINNFMVGVGVSG